MTSSAVKNSVVHKVKQIIDGIYPLSTNAFNKIAELLAYETYSRGEDFIVRRKPNEKEYFVLSGVCKSYLINPEGEEISLSFFVDGTIISPHSTRILKNLSSHNFRALTVLELASINAKKFQQLMIENAEIRNFGNSVLQNELKLKVEKEIGLASLTSKERLKQFRKQYKGLENLIPHTDIASYLGITNISLSRLRKELSQ